MSMAEWAAVPFHKSSFSDTNGGNCVEVGVRPGVIGVRDSKHPAGGVLAISATAWSEFMRTAKR